MQGGIDPNAAQGLDAIHHPARQHPGADRRSRRERANDPPRRKGRRTSGFSARAEAGFTLIELLIATGVLAAICVLIYTAFAGMRSSKEGVERIDDRYHEGREALRRISRELSSAYISLHRPIDLTLLVVKTAFVGTRGTPADRLDFNSFSNRRFDKNSDTSPTSVSCRISGLPIPRILA